MRRAYQKFLPVQKKITMTARLLFICLLFTLKTSAQQVIYFSPGSNRLPDSSITYLKTMAKEFHPSFRLVIHGHTDHTGSTVDNEKLSLARALAVQATLRTAGIPDSVMEVVANGEKKPVAPNQTAAGRQLNRRVELEIIQVDTAPIDEGLNEEDRDDPQGLAYLYAQLKTAPDSFCIRTDRDTALVGKRGTILYYKAHSLASSTCSCVTLYLDEYFDQADMVLNNLTTTSDGQVLESGGMVKLEARCGDSILPLRNDRFITVMVPADTLLPGMKIFSSNRGKQEDILNWKEDPRSGMDTTDMNRLYLACGRGHGIPFECPFFFCRLKALFRSGKERKVDQNNQLIHKGRELMDKYAMSEEQLGKALGQSKGADPDALKYYVFKNFNWDYRNIDRYKNGPITDFMVATEKTKNRDVKIIYKGPRSIVPGTARKADFIFKDVPKDMEIYIVGLGYEEGQAWLGFENSNTRKKEAALTYRKVSLEEIKQTINLLHKK
jgi:hypothetical protein